MPLNRELLSFKIMLLKSSLHIHINDDPLDGHWIDYNFYDLVDRAKDFGFKVLGLTCHNKIAWRKEYEDYAKKNGLMLLSGIEKDIRSGIFKKNHVLIFNAKKDIKNVVNFEDLKRYKKKNPGIFIVAPHPGFDRKNSISLKNLEKYIDLFDAIEHSWFFSKNINLNKRVERIARRYQKPMIATSDLHEVRKIKDDYVVVESDHLSQKSFFQAIKNHKIKNKIKPKKNFDLLFSILRMELKYYFFYYRKYGLFKNR